MNLVWQQFVFSFASKTWKLIFTCNFTFFEKYNLLGSIFIPHYRRKWGTNRQKRGHWRWQKKMILSDMLRHKQGKVICAASLVYVAVSLVQTEIMCGLRETKPKDIWWHTSIKTGAELSSVNMHRKGQFVDFQLHCLKKILQHIFLK